jgi:hypothetical protein
VSTSRRRPAPRAADYVFIDWGRDFVTRHNLAFPDLAGAGTFFNLGPLGLRYILEAGGSGYFRRKMIERHVEAGELHLVPGAAEFVYPAYAVCSDNADEEAVTPALAGLRHVAGRDAGIRPAPRQRRRKPAARVRR